MALKRLGRGLNSLLESSDKEAAGSTSQLRPEQVRPNPQQPRTEFDMARLQELAASIADNGVLQPIVVRPCPGSKGDYELIAGERRLRAAKQLGIELIPAIIKDVDDDKMLELSLVENIQREDLNPIEKARAYKQLIDDLDLTQEEAAMRVGKDRASVANFIRLLDLPDDIQKTVADGQISMGHARSLLGLPTQHAQRRLCGRIVEEGLSVRRVEQIVAEHRDRKREPAAAPAPAPPKSAEIADLEDRLRRALGTRVQVTQDKDKPSGKIIVEFYSNEDFERLAALLGI